MKKQIVSTLMMAVFTLVFLLSAGMLLAYYGEGVRQQQAFRALERITEQANNHGGENSKTAAVQTEQSAKKKAAQEYNALKEKNPDFWGWIKIDDTALSYPVMHTPEEPEYYLRRDFEGVYSLRGVPFLDARCYDGCGNYIIYGHYMKDGTMFGSLQAYAKPAYCEAHPTITLNTATGCADYTVMAAFYSQVYSQEDSGVFRYYQYADLSNEADFAAYVEQVQKAALYDTGVNAQYGEQLLTLSTCSYHTDEGRFVVVAKKQERFCAMAAFCLPWRFMLKAFGAKAFNTPNSADQPEPRPALPQNAGGCRCCRLCCPHTQSLDQPSRFRPP